MGLRVETTMDGTLPKSCLQAAIWDAMLGLANSRTIYTTTYEEAQIGRANDKATQLTSEMAIGEMLADGSAHGCCRRETRGRLGKEQQNEDTCIQLACVSYMDDD